MSRRAPLAGFLSAEAISLTGTRVSMIAIPWLVLTTTGSATRTGVVAFAEMAPLVLLKALAGPLVDRVGARRVSLVCDATSAVVVGLVPVLHLAGRLSFPVLVALVAVGGALRGPSDGAKAAFVPSLATHAGVPLERVTGLSGAIERTASFAGAAFAGGLVAALGPAPALTVDAASFAACFVLFGLATRGLGLPPSPAAQAEVSQRTTYVRELRDGWEFLRRDPVLVAISAMVAVTNLLDQAFAAVLLPVWARAGGHGVGVVGLLFAVMSAASVGGALLAAAWAPRLPRFRTYLVAFLLAGAPRFLVLAVGAPLPVVLGVNVVAGLASGFINPVLGAVIYERIPDLMVGRVSALNTALCWSLIPLGGLLGGLLVSRAGVGTAMLVTGGAYFLTTMLPAVRPSFRGLDRTPEPAPPPSERAAA
jgi:MFS family permease